MPYSLSDISMRLWYSVFWYHYCFSGLRFCKFNSNIFRSWIAEARKPDQRRMWIG